MPSELIVTSAPKGLFPGTYGFCAVACSRGMNESTMRSLESISGYRHIDGSVKPVVYSHYEYEISGVKKHAISRIADAGVDYSNRTNKIAHHLVLSDSEMNALSSGPAALCATQGVFVEKWSDSEPPRYLNDRVLNNPLAIAARSIPNGEWRRVAGDPGWAGALASTVKSKRPVALIVRPDQNVLLLFQEALALLSPNERWQATFSTFFTSAPPAARCQWKTLVVGAYDAKVLSDSRALVLDLSEGKLGSVEQFGDASLLVGDAKTLVEAARSGRTSSTTPTFKNQAPLPLRPQPKDLNVFYTDSRPEVDIDALVALPREDGIYNVLESDQGARLERRTISKNNEQASEIEDYDDAQSTSLGQWIFVSVLLVVVLGAIIAVALILAWKSDGSQTTHPSGGEQTPPPSAVHTEEKQYRTTNEFVPPSSDESDEGTQGIEAQEKMDNSPQEQGGENEDSENKTKEKSKEDKETAEDRDSEKELLKNEPEASVDKELSNGEDIEKRDAEKTDASNISSSNNVPEDAKKVVSKYLEDRTNWNDDFNSLKDAKKEFEDEKFQTKLSQPIRNNANDFKKKLEKIDKLIPLANDLYGRWEALRDRKSKVDVALNEIRCRYDEISSGKNEGRTEQLETFKNEFFALDTPDKLILACNPEKAKEGALNAYIDGLRKRTEDLTAEEIELAQNIHDQFKKMSEKLEDTICEAFIKDINKGFTKQYKDPQLASQLEFEKLSQQKLCEWMKESNSCIIAYAYVCSRKNAPFRNKVTIKYNGEKKDDSSDKGTEVIESIERSGKLNKDTKIEQSIKAEYVESVVFDNVEFVNDNGQKINFKLGLFLVKNGQNGSIRLAIDDSHAPEEYNQLFQSLELKWTAVDQDPSGESNLGENYDFFPLLKPDEKKLNESNDNNNQEPQEKPQNGDLQ